jgi:nicotinamidase/pyrazinamidase
MKTVFWNVDTQYDFMRDDETFKGALPVPAAREIEPNLEKLTNYARENNVQVVNTADWHNKDSKEFADEPNFQTTFPPHCLAGTKGAGYVPATEPENAYTVDWQDANLDEKALAEHKGDIVILKDEFSVFTGNKYAEKVVEVVNPERAVVYGVATNVCVDFAVRGLLERGVDVYVPVDAIKELPALPLEETLNAWKEAGARLVTVDDVVNKEVAKYGGR